MGNNLKVQIFPAAQADMEQIFRYVYSELKNPSAAVELIADFEKAFENIRAFPESCPYTQNEYIKDKTLRKLVVKNYIVFYRLKENAIQIARVLYGMRDYAAIP